MRSIEDIALLYHYRRLNRATWISQAEKVRDAYNGDIAIPLPELANAEEKAAVPNLVAQGLDQTAMRVASVPPDIFYHPERPGFKKYIEAARQRRAVNLGWWQDNGMSLKLRRRARWLLGYGCTPVILRPSARTQIPTWHLRNPLASFPAPSDDPDDITPSDCLFAFMRTAEWAARMYPDSYSLLRRPKSTRADDYLTILEYADADQYTTLILSPRWQPNIPTVIDATRPYPPDTPAITTRGSREQFLGSDNVVQLENVPNLSKVCPVVCPGRITLDRDAGQYDGIVGMYQTMAMMFAMEVRAVAKGIWPNTWVVARPNESAKIVRQADGRKGIIGKIEGGDILIPNEAPTYLAPSTIDRLEAYQRSTAGIPADYGGESATNVRTGRRGQDILQATVSYPIQEAQELLARSLEAENRRAVAIDRAYFGNVPKSYYISWRGATGSVSYTPRALWNSDVHTVRYSFPGMDLGNQTIITGQKMGLGAMSKRTGMTLDPQIEDVEAELDQITAEALDAALLNSIQQGAATGTIPPDAVGRIEELVATNRLSLWEAVSKVHQEMQQNQAPAVNPVDPNSPEAQPGLAQPGAGAEAGTAIPPPSPDLAALGSALGALYPSTAAIRQGS
jgi:hypothetical protein